MQNSDHGDIAGNIGQAGGKQGRKNTKARQRLGAVWPRKVGMLVACVAKILGLAVRVLARIRPFLSEIHALFSRLAAG
ncbi:hypothetical protein C0J07_16755 [Bordetella avium]|nr:hypothetical protein C0J07_16755 [Bordetella avium]